jgi:3-dehydroquinate synthase
MNKIILSTPLGNSEIIIQKDGLKIVNKWINDKHPTSKIVIITDANIAGIYKDKISGFFPDAMVISVAAGDAGKSIPVVSRLAKKLLDIGFTRPDVIIGLGGGMITDLAGFLASIYMRGVPLILIPTSLAGMVDAAIGGKTAINLEAKNILGTFYPAEMIMIDPSFITNLSDRRIGAGIAEVIKYAATLDATLADDLMKDEMDLEKIIAKSVNAKANIVNQDMMETGVRKVLNFGHTFGHAIEQMSGYRLLHGEAISIGMALANKAARKLGRQSKETGDRIEHLIKKFNLPTEMPGRMSVESLIDLMEKDKKRIGGKITFIIAPGMGKYEMIQLSPEKLVELVE